jgi:hypothetical protein
MQGKDMGFAPAVIVFVIRNSAKAILKGSQGATLTCDPADACDSAYRLLGPPASTPPAPAGAKIARSTSIVKILIRLNVMSCLQIVAFGTAEWSRLRGRCESERAIKISPQRSVHMYAVTSWNFRPK